MSRRKKVHHSGHMSKKASHKGRRKGHRGKKTVTKA